MAVIFPPVESADKDGFLAIGGDLSIDTLLSAYKQGIFPWPPNEKILAWFAPPQRAVIFTNKTTQQRRLRRFLKKQNWKVSFNYDFYKIVQFCRTAQNRLSKGTWITEEIANAYYNLYKEGFAYSVEIWDEKNNLIGGIYGVNINQMVSGESMFFLKDNASKAAFLALIKLLKDNGIEWLDCQVMHRHTKNLGAISIPRKEFLTLLNKAINKKYNLTFPLGKKDITEFLVKS